LSEDERMFLDVVQESVKSMFGVACFGNWNGKWVPVLVLSPYDCAEEFIRREWNNMYQKYLNSPKGSKMKHLVLWYGFEDLTEKYGFVDEFKSFDNGKKEGLLDRYITRGSHLTTNEQRERDGLKKLSEAINVPSKDRLVRNVLNPSHEHERPFSNYEAILHGTGIKKESNMITRELENKPSFIYTEVMEDTENSKNETELLPIMEQFKDAVFQGERELMFSCLSEISTFVHEIAPSFLFRHEIPEIFKNARRKFKDEEAKAKIKCITDAISSVYRQKIDRRTKNVSKSFDSIAKNLNEEAVDVSVITEGVSLVKRSQPTLVGNSVVLPKNDRQPKEATKSLDTRAKIPRVDITKKKSPFSLQQLIVKSQQSPVTSCVVDIKKDQQTSKTASLTPKWLTEDLQTDVEQHLQDVDKNREIGKELLCCIDAYWPDEISENINFETFISQLEQAIFQWSQSSQIDNPTTSRKVQTGEYNYPYPDNYFKKLGHIISGLSVGNFSDLNQTPSLLYELVKGKFPTPMDLVKLSGSEIYNSIKG